MIIINILSVLPLAAGFAATSGPAFLATYQASRLRHTHGYFGETVLHVSFQDDITTVPVESFAAATEEVLLGPELTTVPEVPDCLIYSWECDVEQQIRKELKARDPKDKTPYMVGVVGIPGSGKSTSSSIVTTLLSDVGALLMPFDGYHYSVAELLQFPNPEDVIYRRGAPDTFNVNALRRDLERIRNGDEATVSVPGFDHATADPEQGAHTFQRGENQVVVVEGLYLLHDTNGWDSIKQLFDLTIFVEADVDVCVERLKVRNKVIPGYTPEEIELRCEVVDRANAMAVELSKKYADITVQGIAARAAA